MKKPPDGGPAFPRIDGIEPVDHGASSVVGTSGMTLRDYFAAHAMGSRICAGESSAFGIAFTAYAIADEMLRRRETAKEAPDATT